ncbi:fructokinase [Actinokineospora alba]|uniref:Fructokinase n=1 Tax=Actinokineospora alba TaxID=504798 RepID=A0A1H0G4B1_9PSEU|nr:carbohydrate kinase [Actinokineospora alba]TDP69755.1 fructokinase [Actinokineospora alba]SDI09453.1 fructokinase [Actinokineospora alba]SDO01702.1 fructokinase [Actinokineospora alba]
MNPRVIVAGEALIDLIVGEDPRRPTAIPGGSPANTAIALARLGTPVTFLGRFGSDTFGELLRTNLAANGVDLAYAVAADEPASLAVVTHTSDGPAYGFHVSGTADWAWQPTELPDLPAEVRAVHTGSLALALEPGASVLGRWFAAQREHRVTSFDPNIRPALVGPREEYRQRLTALWAVSDIVKVSVEDLQWVYPDSDPVAVGRRLQDDHGTPLVVVTLGGEGAVALHGGRTCRRRAAPVSVVDTVGAGDTFSGGLLHWLDENGALSREGLRSLTEQEIDQALEFAITVAGLACTRPGADPPRRAEAHAALQRSQGMIGS